MLKDEYFKILEYEPDCTKIFPDTDIKGGFVVPYRDDSKLADIFFEEIPEDRRNQAKFQYHTPQIGFCTEEALKCLTYRDYEGACR